MGAVRRGTGRRRYQSTNIPTVSFVELGFMMAGRTLSHKDMKTLWRAMCSTAQVDSTTLPEFVASVIKVRDELFDAGETATWKAITQRALELSCPSYFEFLELR